MRSSSVKSLFCCAMVGMESSQKAAKKSFSFMYFGVVTLFPEMFDAVTKSGVTRRACENGLIKVECFNPRTYTLDLVTASNISGKSVTTPKYMVNNLRPTQPQLS